MSSHDDLSFGLYERLVTIGLRAKLLRIDPTRVRIVTKDVEPAELHETLARHLGEILAQALNGVSDPDRVARQAGLANRLIGHLVDQVADPTFVDATVHTPPQQLHAVQALTGAPGDDREVAAPLLGLSASDLLVNARGEPALAHALSSGTCLRPSSRWRKLIWHPSTRWRSTS